jgi:hypothetical protein
VKEGAGFYWLRIGSLCEYVNKERKVGRQTDRAIFSPCRKMLGSFTSFFNSCLGILIFTPSTIPEVCETLWSEAGNKGPCFIRM